MEKFIKFYVLVSLWFWAGMLLSAPLRKAFEDMHLRMLERIYNATLGQVVKLFKKIIDSISQRYKKVTLYAEDRTYEMRVRVARSLVSEELLGELMQKNLVAAIARARMMDQGYNSGVTWDEIQAMGQVALGKAVGSDHKKEGVDTAFKLCDTDLFKQIITRIPKAQERILVAFDRIEGNAPYDSIKNEEFRKFIRE